MKCKSCNTEDETHFDEENAVYCVQCAETNAEIADEIAYEENKD